MKPLIVLAAALSLAGCVSTQPITDNDFIEQVLPIDHDTALKNLREGWQKCNDARFGQPSYIQFEDHTSIDVYGLTPHLKQRTDQMIGRVELWSLVDATRVRSGMPQNFNRKRRQNWLDWAAGNLDCKIK